MGAGIRRQLGASHPGGTLLADPAPDAPAGSWPPLGVRIARPEPDGASACPPFSRESGPRYALTKGGRNPPGPPGPWGPGGTTPRGGWAIPPRGCSAAEADLAAKLARPPVNQEPGGQSSQQGRRQGRHGAAAADGHGEKGHDASGHSQHTHAPLWGTLLSTFHILSI